MDWQIYSIMLIALITVGIFVRRWIKKSEANCCGGRCGCAVSKRNKKQRSGQKLQVNDDA